jgi:hypothetical protein
MRKLERKHIAEQQESLRKLDDEIESALKEIMLENSYNELITKHYRIETIKPRTEFNKKRLKEYEPHIYEKYEATETKEVVKRSFNVDGLAHDEPDIYKKYLITGEPNIVLTEASEEKPKPKIKITENHPSSHADTTTGDMFEDDELKEVG